MEQSKKITKSSEKVTGRQFFEMNANMPMMDSEEDEDDSQEEDQTEYF